MKKIFAGIMPLLMIGCASVHNEVIVDASPSEVWQVLTDRDAYPEWNTVLLDLKGDFKVGEQVVFQFKEAEGKQYEVKAKVEEVVPDKLLNQKGGMWGILTFDHKYILEPVGEKTKVTIHEDYAGVYVPFWDHKPLEPAYAKLNQALKARVEALR